MYKLTEQEITNSLLINDKQRFIDELKPHFGDGDYERVSEFFKSHANLENKIDWQKIEKSPMVVVQDILDLIETTSKKKEVKTNIRSMFKDTDHFEILGEDDNFIYVAPLTWEACKFIDSYKCGGEGATWCIGWEKSDVYWKSYTNDDCVFVLMMKKPNSQVSILETLNSDNDIDTDAIYRFDNYDAESDEGMEEKYPNDNKVMFQIDSSGYVTAWEQADDFPLFQDVSINRIIDVCGLGFDWDESEYLRISDAIKIKQYDKRWFDIVIDNGDGTVTIDLDSYNDSDIDYDTINEYLYDNFDHVNLTFIGTGAWAIPYILNNVSCITLDLSQVKVRHGLNLRDFLCSIGFISDKLDLSCLDVNDISEIDDFLNALSCDKDLEIVVNPNCTALIDYINECNEKKGYEIKVILAHDYSDQLSFDFGE